MKTRDSQKRVVDLCIYVDENAYKEDVDKEKLFDALYNIVIRISHKHRVLQKFEDYESFALYAAGRLYTRLTNPKQFLPERFKTTYCETTSTILLLFRISSIISSLYRTTFFTLFFHI